MLVRPAQRERSVFEPAQHPSSRLHRDDVQLDESTRLMKSMAVSLLAQIAKKLDTRLT